MEPEAYQRLKSLQLTEFSADFQADIYLSYNIDSFLYDLKKNYFTESVTKGSPDGVLPSPETRPTYCRQCELISDTGHTETEQPLSRGPALHTPGAPPTGLPEGHGRTLSPSPQNTCIPLTDSQRP